MNQPNALAVLIRAMEIGSSEAILEQEAHGQRDLVNNTLLPQHCIGCERADLEAMGIVFGEQADDLFVQATLPAGWRKESTSHSMWSNLLDDKGRTRAAIFYKAAFYDRSAHISACQAINVTRAYSEDGDTVRAIVKHGDTVLYQGEPITRELNSRAYFDAIDAADRAAQSWVETNYPDYRNFTAYW